MRQIKRQVIFWRILLEKNNAYEQLVKQSTVLLKEYDDFQLRIYDEIYEDLFDTNEMQGVVERSYSIETIKSQINLEKPVGYVQFPARYEGEIVEANLAYMLYVTASKDVWVIIMPTPEQIMSVIDDEQ